MSEDHKEDHKSSHPKKSFWTRLWLLLLLAAVGALLLFLGVIGSRIVRAAGEPGDSAGAVEKLVSEFATALTAPVA